MNLLELKNLLAEKITVVWGYNAKEVAGGLDMVYNCQINKKFELKEFLQHLKTIQDNILEELLKLDSINTASRVLFEYEQLQQEFSEIEIAEIKYLKFNNISVYEDESFFMLGTSLENKKFSEKKQMEVNAFLKIERPTEEEFLDLLKPTEVQVIVSPTHAKIIDTLSTSIKENIGTVITFIKQHFIQGHISEIGNKELDRLNVKQQILILNYLFACYRNSEVEIPNNKLSQLLGKILGRNSETIRSLLTYMPRVEDNESDDKIAKTPKNLNAVGELFDAFKLQPLKLLVQKDIEKMKKIAK